MPLDWPWIVSLGAFLTWFAIFETYALKHPERMNTLSRFVWNIGQAWPLSLVVFGMVFGGLAVHFFWNWCPALGSQNGMLLMPQLGG